MLHGALINSMMTQDNPFCSTDEALAWIERRNREVSVSVEAVPFSALRGWHFDETSGDLCHDSGRFFSIVGLDVLAHDQSGVRRWRQPIIRQPEVGYLGILAKIFDGVLYFLLQAKIEPGNVNCVQLSPTLQATRSNYTCVHGGRPPVFLEYFRDADPRAFLVDQLQSEQGARFLRKRNRNMVVVTEDDVPNHEDFRWLTLGQIQALMRRDNMVNMDTRTVLSGLRFRTDTHAVPIGGHACSGYGLALAESDGTMCGVLTIDGILQHLSALKSEYELLAERIPLQDVADWQVTDGEIVRPDRKFFRVFGVNVTIANREVASWCQPIVEPMQRGLCVLLAKRVNGVVHFLLQAKVECGNFDVVEFAPTIQCLTGDYRNVPAAVRPAFLDDFLEGRLTGTVLSDVWQSEEGGRFYHEQNRNVVLLLDDATPLRVPDNFLWLTLGQIREFLRFNNYLNIQVRSLIAGLSYR